MSKRRYSMKNRKSRDYVIHLRGKGKAAVCGVKRPKGYTFVHRVVDCKRCKEIMRAKRGK